MRVIFHKSNRNNWIWTVQDTGNWKIIGASSEDYVNKDDCINNFEQLTGRPVKEVVDESGNTKLIADVTGDDWEVKVEE